MVAEPVEHHEDPLDPQRILRELPGRERPNFLAAYREALDGAPNVIRCPFIFSGKNDELTPDFPPQLQLPGIRDPRRDYPFGCGSPV